MEQCWERNEWNRDQNSNKGRIFNGRREAANFIAPLPASYCMALGAMSVFEEARDGLHVMESMCYDMNVAWGVCLRRSVFLSLIVPIFPHLF
ncbi:hypothetical protein J6590_036560 [Homalodisca vitripennis]|nr:hypothetical protein J6590_036560 [Homalodisca vitripennis]